MNALPLFVNSEAASLRRQLDESNKRRNELAIACGRAEGLAAHLTQSLGATTERLAARDAELSAVRGELGDLRDWVDELVTCKTLSEVLARIATLTEGPEEQEPDDDAGLRSDVARGY